MQFVDRWFAPGTIYDVPDQYFVYALFGLVGLIDLMNLLGFFGVKVCINIMKKLAVYRRGFQHLFFSNVQKWKPQKEALDPENCPWPKDNERMAADTRRIILVRHGESEWNKVFNRGFAKGMIVVRILLYPVLELLKFAFADSYFYDSPLSDRGLKECHELADFLRTPPAKRKDGVVTALERDKQDLRGDPQTRSVVVSSQLRRAAGTAAIGLWPRLQSTTAQGEEQVLLLSSLMEQSRNFDCVPLSSMYEVPPLREVEKSLNDPSFGAHVFNPSGNMGDKPVRASGRKGFDRIMNFVEFCFQPELSKTTIIAVGHSMFFRRFFNCFLSHSLDSVAKEKKIQNGGVVGITLQRCQHAGKTYYRIHPSEITEVFKGFKR